MALDAVSVMVADEHAEPGRHCAYDDGNTHDERNAPHQKRRCRRWSYEECEHEHIAHRCEGRDDCDRHQRQQSRMGQTRPQTQHACKGLIESHDQERSVEDRYPDQRNGRGNGLTAEIAHGDASDGGRTGTD